MSGSSRIIMISGRPGTGKTTLVGNLLVRHSDWKLVESITTRPPRESDLPGEYQHVSAKEFHQRKRRGEFAWTVPKWYGTTRPAIESALIAEAHRLMILTPSGLVLLNEYAAGRIISFHLQSPSDEELCERMLKRGDPPERILERLKETEGWDKNMQDIAATISPVYFILPSSPEEIVRSVLQRVEDEG